MLLKHLADILLFLQKTEPVNQQIVEIHRPKLELLRIVLAGNLNDLLRCETCRLRLPACSNQFNRLRLILRLGDHLGDDLLLWKILRILHR